MEQHELLLFVVECFEKLKIPYLVTGAIASIAYGESRFTNDIDVVVDMNLTLCCAPRVEARCQSSLS